MLEKKYRFHSRGGVRYVYQKGKTIRKPKMSLVFTDNTRKYSKMFQRNSIIRLYFVKNHQLSPSPYSPRITV